MKWKEKQLQIYAQGTEVFERWNKHLAWGTAVFQRWKEHSAWLQQYYKVGASTPRKTGRNSNIG